jgi:hypothetical protein
LVVGAKEEGGTFMVDATGIAPTCRQALTLRVRLPNSMLYEDATHFRVILLNVLRVLV